METSPIARCTPNMEDPIDKLLKLIEDGDADIILSEENMQGSLNELVKHELVLIKEDKIFLTELGQRARTEGVKKVISGLKPKPMIQINAAPVIERKIRSSNTPYYILLILGLLLILAIQFIWN